jgi:putative DNA primase/helicase
MYDGTRWTTDAPGGAYPAIKDVIRLLYRYASEAPTSAREAILKNLLKLEKHQTQRDILAAASNIPRLIISSSQLDQDPMLLNCLNGTIDLKTGELHPHDPANIPKMPCAPCSKNFLTASWPGTRSLSDTFSDSSAIA